ncbi:hypothetical protein ACNKHO_23145 [Shigella flexneri]
MRAVSLFYRHRKMNSLATCVVAAGQRRIVANVWRRLLQMGHYAEYDYLIVNDDFDTAPAISKLPLTQSFYV